MGQATIHNSLPFSENSSTAPVHGDFLSFIGILIAMVTMASQIFQIVQRLYLNKTQYIIQFDIYI